MKVEQIARVAHEVNRAYLFTITTTTFTPVAWEDLPQYERDCAIREVEFYLEDSTRTPQEAHANWLKAKREAGWKYGPVKNRETKEHPYCVEYDKLPIEQRTVDLLFRSVVHAMAWMSQ